MTETNTGVGFGSFEQAFRTLTGHEPFPWQKELFGLFSQGVIPSLCDLPTGLGKTSVIAVWLIALKHGASVPRRLVYVVNRRTVVDQTTSEVEKLRQNLDTPELLAISTLRGQFADNREWSTDPLRPAVIVGTVDMIGSRLLFAGYGGLGFRSRPLHAGFLGQDALIVHDEAHLEPAFQKLIEAISHEQSRSGDFRQFRILKMTATTRGSGDAVAEDLSGLTDEERNPPEDIPDPPAEPIHHVWRRLKATKQLHLHRIEDDKKAADEVAKLALAHKGSGAAVLVYLRKVEDALRVAGTLGKELKKSDLPQRVQTLTGTMRGHEREELLRTNDVFARFMPSRPESVGPAEGTVYLVCTSAGEVGVDISADHMVCDLSTFDSMAQRFGRVNRYGDRDDTVVDVAHPKEFGKKKGSEERERTEMDERRGRTLDLLEQLKGDASPLALSGLDAEARLDAFAPTPTIPRATDILFDAWAMTTIRGDMPGRPPVAPYLHGIAEWEPPRTKVAWRDEVDVVTPELVQDYGEEFPRSLLDDYPLKPHELLSDTTERVFTQLGEIHKRATDGCIVWIVEDGGEVEVSTINNLRRDDKNRAIRRLANHTILLPPSIGGLAGHGMMDGKVSSESAPQDGLDVADLWLGEDDRHRRRRFFSSDPRPLETPKGMTLIRTIDMKPFAEDQVEREAAEMSRRFWHWFARPRDAEDATRASPEPVVWEKHIDDVAGWAERITERLELGEDLRKAVVLAARWHDLGKKRELWQRSIGNPEPSQWHAKGGKPWRPRRLSEYRHEFGSLLDATDPSQKFAEELGSLTEDVRDIVLHLIAAHHGYARPHFPPEATVDPKHPQSVADKVALEVPRRYARLQRRFGRWGLAYLESLLRAADWAASAKNPGSGVPTGGGDE